MTIQGVNVQGVAAGEQDLAERLQNLALVHHLEEQERELRMMKDETKPALSESQERMHSLAWEETEFQEIGESFRRKHDASGEQRKRIIARRVSSFITADLSASSRLRGAADALLESAQPEVLYSAAVHAGEQAKGVTLAAAETVVDRAKQLGSFALRTAWFFGSKAVEQAQMLSNKASEQVHSLGSQAQELSTKATEEAQYLGAKASTQAHVLAEKAREQAHLLGEKAVETAQFFGEQAAVQAQALGESAIGKAQELSQAIPDAITLANLSFLEETERVRRLTSDLSIERFLLALQVSALIKESSVYSPLSEPNRWYATAVLEEFERARRFVHDAASNEARVNAKKIAYFVLTHPSFAKKAREVDNYSAQASSTIQKKIESAEQTYKPLMTGFPAM